MCADHFSNCFADMINNAISRFNLLLHKATPATYQMSQFVFGKGIRRTIAIMHLILLRVKIFFSSHSLISYTNIIEFFYYEKRNYTMYMRQSIEFRAN